MTGSFTCVKATLSRLATKLVALYVPGAARDAAEDNVVAYTLFRHGYCAGGAISEVTEVGCFVPTDLRDGTGVLARWKWSATWYWRWY